jgi:hypothetical protein
MGQLSCCCKSLNKSHLHEWRLANLISPKSMIVGQFDDNLQEFGVPEKEPFATIESTRLPLGSHQSTGDEAAPTASQDHHPVIAEDDEEEEEVELPPLRF